mmetsp:Transcript_13323/g.31424  ORF Transcript_13323/g.31424 Transcript_13323/m.31424 type:complete len:251 (+) Transcript_13323:150-902(+)
MHRTEWPHHPEWASHTEWARHMACLSPMWITALRKHQTIRKHKTIRKHQTTTSLASVLWSLPRHLNMAVRCRVHSSSTRPLPPSRTRRACTRSSSRCPVAPRHILNMASQPTLLHCAAPWTTSRPVPLCNPRRTPSLAPPVTWSRGGAGSLTPHPTYTPCSPSLASRRPRLQEAAPASSPPPNATPTPTQAMRCHLPTPDTCSHHHPACELWVRRVWWERRRVCGPAAMEVCSSDTRPQGREATSSQGAD